jgi:hypothetical protein
MQSRTLRTKIAAAALLLAPLAALVAAQPAAAQSRFEEHHFVRDQRAPDIYAITPQQGDRVGEHGLTRISARFSDDRSGVDPRGVTLRVDGRDVTRHARVDRDDIRYADNLRPGRHFAELVVRDHAGNLARRAWNFDVGGHDHDRFSDARR